MYLVRFVRNDESIDELYYYLQEEDALYHIRLFNNDDSGLYKRVELPV